MTPDIHTPSLQQNKMLIMAGSRVHICPLLCIFSLLLGSCNGGGVPSSDSAAVQDTLRYARLISVEKGDEYTKVALRDPWDTLRDRATYLLVDRDSALPDNMPSGTVIRVPVERVAIFTSLYVNLAEVFGCLDDVVGVCEPEFITSEQVRELLRRGKIANLGPSTSPDIEKMMELDVDAIIASPFENSGFGTAGKLGIPIIEAADYMETHPLGRSEWIRFYGLLFGKGALADTLFKDTECNYLRLRDLVSNVSVRPTVLLERKYGATWFVPSGGSYIGTIHKDAGADYIFSDIPGANSRPVPFETVFEKGYKADFWLIKQNGRLTLNSLAKEYGPYSDFEAFRKKSVFVCNTVESSYYEDFPFHPDYLLEDLISIYHPELLPGYTMRYYNRVEEK